MKTNKTAFYLICVILAALCVVNAGCGHSGGMTSEEIQRETDAEFAKLKNKTDSTERLRRELSQIPTQEQITKTPYKNPTGSVAILEREEGGEYKFVSAPLEDGKTGEMPAANTLIAALVEYKREPSGQYKIVEDNRVVPGYILNAEMTLVDFSIPAVIHRKTFKGEKPKPTITGSNTVAANQGGKEVVGPKPIEEIKKYLSSLPLKK